MSLNDLTSETPFILYALMSVTYEGRAKSVLGPGKRLLIHKRDGSVLIHGADLTTPLNYMSPGTEMAVDTGKIKFIRKGETITVDITMVDLLQKFNDWSDEKLLVTKTESELVEILASDPVKYFGFQPADLEKEYQTEHGVVDLLLFENFCHATLDGEIVHNVEVKRKKATLNNCHQVMKYAMCLRECGAKVKNWIAAPDISQNALKYCEKYDIKYVHVDFE